MIIPMFKFAETFGRNAYLIKRHTKVIESNDYLMENNTSFIVFFDLQLNFVGV